MTFNAFLRETQLDNTFLLGFYGGGNYGDELLLEVLLNLFEQRHVKNLKIFYQNPKLYRTFHHDFGHQLVNQASKPALMKAILTQKNIVVGGGGLWGMDIIPNVFFMSLLLWVSRWVLGKQVYLLAVGYYNSTSWLGHLSAWLAGKAATRIVARDDESYANFSRINKHTVIDGDIAWHIEQLGLKPYEKDLAQLEKRLTVTHKTLFVSLRRFKDGRTGHYQQAIEECIQQNPDLPVIVILLEPRSSDPKGYKLLQQWQRRFKHIQITDFSYNPLALFMFMQKHRARLAYVGPQFHGILSAKVAGVPFLPIAYDNKVSELLQTIDESGREIPIHELTPGHVQQFIVSTLKGR